tara:strand:+ start:713 stop:1207 length:495 start_codon:yes stop_codon:yes gene_type:complete
MVYTPSIFGIGNMGGMASVSPESSFLALGPLDLGNDPILKKYEKNKKRNQNGETDEGEDTGGEVDGTPDGPEETEKNPFYGDMKPKEFYEMLEGMGQRGANRAFFKEGARAFANAPLVSIPVMQQMLQETGGVTRQQMASFGNMVNSTAFSPTRQKIAGKYFNL